MLVTLIFKNLSCLFVHHQVDIKPTTKYKISRELEEGGSGRKWLMQEIGGCQTSCPDLGSLTKRRNCSWQQSNIPLSTIVFVAIDSNCISCCQLLHLRQTNVSEAIFCNSISYSFQLYSLAVDFSCHQFAFSQVSPRSWFLPKLTQICHTNVFAIFTGLTKGFSGNSVPLQTNSATQVLHDFPWHNTGNTC